MQLELGLLLFSKVNDHGTNIIRQTLYQNMLNSFNFILDETEIV